MSTNRDGIWGDIPEMVNKSGINVAGTHIMITKSTLIAQRNETLYLLCCNGTYWAAGAKVAKDTLAIPAHRTEVACNNPFMTLHLSGSWFRAWSPKSSSKKPTQSIILVIHQPSTPIIPLEYELQNEEDEK
jgi:hypothetical protein